MARKAGSTILQEELYPPNGASAREELDDARLFDLDVDEESPFLRAQKRVSARRSALPKKTASWLMRIAAAAAVLCAAGVAAAGVYRYGERSWRFRVESSDDIEVTGMKNVTKAQIMEVMGADIGRHIFFIPLDQQKVQLEQIPWVESASVMRFVPNRLKVEIHERTPVAFARVGPRIALIDAGGTLMELPPKRKYSFPVILGMNPGEPLSTRAPRMKAYAELIRALDSDGAHYSQELSEVDLSDLDNLKVRVNHPAGDVLVQLGSSDYLKRYKIYVSHSQEWRQQFQKLESVNLRYDNQVIVNPDMQGSGKTAALTLAAARAAAAAGVKPAALVTRLPRHDKTLPKPAFELPESKLNQKTTTGAAKRPVVKTRLRKTTSRKWKVGAISRRPEPPSTGATARRTNSAKEAPAPVSQKPLTKTRGTNPAPEGLGSGLPKPSPAVAKQQPNQQRSQQASQGPN
jgi:cell division protein FtsQ